MTKGRTVRTRARRRRAPLLAALLALAVAAAARPATAGQDPGIRLGWYGGVDADAPVPVVGVYARVDVPGPVNLELSADYRKERLHHGELESVVVPFRASAVVSFFPVVSPYLLAGVGMDYNRVTFPGRTFGAETSWLFEAHAGVGVELALGPVSVVADVRYCSSAKVSNDSLNQVLGHDYDPSGWYASLAAGISF